MEQAQNLSPLHFDHKLGLFGDHENKENLLKISEIKDLSIFQIAKFKKSSIEIEKITINQLNLPTESLKVSHNQETRVLWTGPDTWLIISKKIDLKDEIYKSIRDQDFAITDISQSRAVLQISGVNAKNVLKKGSPINFNENMFKPNNCVNTTYNGINILIDYLDDQPFCFNLYALRSFGGSFYHSITDSSLEYGYEGI